MTTENDFSMSQLSLNSTGSQGEDWDRSFVQHNIQGGSDTSRVVTHQNMTTPRNSVVFPSPVGEDNERTPGKRSASNVKRPLSELLRLHAEKGTDVKCSPEDASRLAEVLGQWINSWPSPYEGDDDFFSGHSQDDSSLPKRVSSHDTNVRPRGQSESCVRSRPSSSMGAVTNT